MKSTQNIFLPLIFIIFVSSCSIVKDSLFLSTNNQKKPPVLPQNPVVANDTSYKHKVQFINPGDVISFRNLQNETQVLGYISGAGGIASSSEYEINPNGFVDLPSLGKIKLSGLTIEEAENFLNKAYSEKLLKEPAIKIFINNLKVTLLGEFAKQGNIPLKKNYTHLTEVLGEAGGFTLKADASKVKIIRGDLKNPEIVEVNLKNIKSLGDSRLYLRNNDIVYVDVKPSAKFFDELNSARTLIGLAVSVLSVYLITERIR